MIPFFRKVLAEKCEQIPITDPRMTRFSITLDQGVDFVIRSFERMHGGEIFVPKIPSFRIVDLAEVMAPGMAHDVVGIRPGEKLHEIMIPRDCSHESLEFEQYYVIKPSIYWGRRQEFEKNVLGQKGRVVEDDFEYSSATNRNFLNESEISELLKLV